MIDELFDEPRRVIRDGGGWFKVIRQAELLPEGYGVAWYVWNENAIVCAPIPLNVLVAWTRDFYLWMRQGPQKRDCQLAYSTGFEEGRMASDRHREAHEKALAEAYSKGHLDGTREILKVMYDELRGQGV